MTNSEALESAMAENFFYVVKLFLGISLYSIVERTAFFVLFWIPDVTFHNCKAQNETIQGFHAVQKIQLIIFKLFTSAKYLVGEELVPK